MKTVLQLAKLETSRFSPYLIGTKKSDYKWILLGMILFLASNVVVMRHFDTVAGLMMTNTLFLFESLILLFLVEHMNFTKRQERDWWLLLPHSRMTLVLGKAMGYCRIGLHLIIYLTVIRSIHYGLFVGWGGMEAVGFPELLKLIGANVLMVLAGMPVLIGIGVLLIVFQVWWGRILIVLLFMYTFVPVLAFMVLAGDADYASFYLNPSEMVRYAVWTASIGWPVAALCLWLAAKAGLKHLGRIRYKNGWHNLLNDKPLSSTSDAHEMAVRPQRRRTPFRTLLAMERRRYLLVTSSTVGKIVAGVIFAAILLLSYRSASELREYVGFMSFLVLFGYMGIVIYFVNRQAEFQKGYAQWWISLPHSRLLLAGSRALGYLSVVMPYWAMMLLSGISGGILRQWIDPMPQAHWPIACQYIVYYFILFIPLTVLYVIAMQGAPSFLSLSWRSVLAAPLYAGYVLGFQLANEVIRPSRELRMKFEEGPNPDFASDVLLLYGFAIPFALFCFWLGIKYMNNYSLVRDSGRDGKRPTIGSP